MDELIESEINNQRKPSHIYLGRITEREAGEAHAWKNMLVRTPRRYAERKKQARSPGNMNFVLVGGKRVCKHLTGERPSPETLLDISKFVS